MQVHAKTIVVKLGGNVLTDVDATAGIAADVVALIAAGNSVVLVHGGGNLIDEHLKALGIKLEKKEGLRVTNAETLEAVQEVLDFVNADLGARLAAAGVVTEGFNSKSGLLTASKAVIKNVAGIACDLGFVGTVNGVDSTALKAAIAEGKTPLVAPLAVDVSGQLFNINADEVASAVASALAADSLLFMSDVPGVLHKEGLGSLPVVSPIDLDKLMADGTVHSGMIPKLEKAFEALETGVSSVQIIDGRQPGSLLKALSKPGSNGTVLAVKS